MSFRNMCLQYAEHGLAKQLWTEFTYPPVIAMYGVFALAGYAVCRVARAESDSPRDLIITAIIGSGVSIIGYCAAFESLYG
jgi:hypothetical protein